MADFDLRILMLRPLALMIPAVTVEARLNGLPTATAHSPTCTLSELANSMKGNPLPSILSKAISVEGSVPTILAL